MLKLLVFILVGSFSNAFAGESNSCFQIDTGEQYCDFVFKANAQQLWIAGSGDLKHVTNIVSPHGVKPILDKNGRALASFAFVQYVSSTVGPYNEFIVMYAVQRKDQNLGPYSPLSYTLKNSLPQKDAKNPEYGFFMQKLVLGGSNKKSVQAAIEVGIKGYGFPKIAGDVDYDFDPSRPFQVSVQSHDGSIKLTGSMDSSYFGSVNLVALPVVINALTTGLGEPRWSRATGFAWGGIPQSAKNLRLSIDGSDEIKNIKFQPAMVTYSGRYRFDLESVK